MGVSGGRQKNKPIYSKEIGGASSALTNAFNVNMPKIQGVTDKVTGLLPDMIEKYKAGDAGVNAARNYVTTTLGGDATNPHLDDWISLAQDEAQNRMGAKLAKMGLGPAGSTYQGTVGREVAKIGLGARYEDWLRAQDRRAQAAGMAPGIAAADTIQIAPILGAAGTASDPMRAAVGYASGIGGLLGQYQDVKTKNPWGPALLSGLSNAAAAYAGGG